ncbi:hypothetical protein [Neoaquamicrobium sediminum]|uniref:hypothetical protein n=1 Tax=Neoaquamicrobium sediminum TaxID=1849104 RepID=UPI0015665DCA|nr:hypothetical protein [Mesorhizobium sediminum]NRC54164.1 hypothetical protein [Mesorhizobium sediminum]
MTQQAEPVRNVREKIAQRFETMANHFRDERVPPLELAARMSLMRTEILDLLSASEEQ